MKIYYESYLTHHGIKGQKWGVRRFQNPDGTLTSQGKLRYSGSGFGSGSKSGGGHPKQFKSARALRKYMNSEDFQRTNMKALEKEYRKEFKNNKEYHEIGHRLLDLNKQFRANDAEFKKITAKNDYIPTREQEEAYKKKQTPIKTEAIECVKKLDKTKRDINQKYLKRLNEAKLKDLGWDGDVNEGIKKLAWYDEAATISLDGYVRDGGGSSIFPPSHRWYMIPPDDRYRIQWD